MESCVFGAWAAPGPRRLGGDGLLLDCAVNIPLTSPVMLRNDFFAEAVCGEAWWGAGRGLHPPTRVPRVLLCDTGVACPEADGQSPAGRWLQQRERWRCFCTSGCVSRRAAGLRLALLSEEGLGASERGGKSCHTSRNRKKITLCKVKFLYQASQQLLAFNYIVPTPSLRLCGSTG